MKPVRARTSGSGRLSSSTGGLLARLMRRRSGAAEGGSFSIGSSAGSLIDSGAAASQSASGRPGSTSVSTVRGMALPPVREVPVAAGSEAIDEQWLGRCPRAAGHDRGFEHDRCRKNTSSRGILGQRDEQVVAGSPDAEIAVP